MRRRLATLAAVSMFVLAWGAAPALAAGSPLTHASIPAEALNEEGPICGYVFTSGAFSVVGRDFTTAAHLTAHSVVAERGGESYKVVGSEIYDDLKGHLTWKMMFIARGGGLADSINVVLRYDRDGELRVGLENDSCHIYG